MNPTTEPKEPRFWCDDFDADLYQTVPEIREVLAPFESILLHTRGHSTNGRLNHPAAFNSHLGGLVSFFTFPGKEPHPTRYDKTSPIVECTFAEAIRDCWVHTLMLCLCGRIVFKPPEMQAEFQALLYWVRKWGQQADPVFERSKVLIAVKRAAAEFEGMVMLQDDIRIR